MLVVHTYSRRRFKQGLRAGVSAVALLALTTGVGPGRPVLAADGGAGLSIAGGPGGAGGVDGTLAEATGQDGASIAPGGTEGAAGIGGGGAVDLTTGNGAPGGARGLYGTGVVRGAAGATGATGLVVTTPTTITTAIGGGIGGEGDSSSLNVRTAGGGGGGGVGVSATATLTITGTGAVAGGDGYTARNTGGGGGGVGVFSSANVTVEAGGVVTGGSGGGYLFGAGGGGGGAAAIVLTTDGVIANSGTLTGGAGGGTMIAAGGDGGAGVQLLAGGTVINASGGVITGGAGGVGRVVTTVALPTAPGEGGAGIKGANIAVINAGTITGGAGGTGSGWTPVDGRAILFTGGVNSLEIRAGSVIGGTVTAFSAADTFRLGGDIDAAFDVSAIDTGGQYQGFGLYEVVGTAAWTVTGTTATVTPWTLSGGVLGIASDGSLGDPSGGLVFNGGMLRFDAEFDLDATRTIEITAAGAGIDTNGFTTTIVHDLAGQGGLSVTGAGTLILTGENSYTGGTSIDDAATLQLGDGGTSGSVVGDVANNGTLVIDRSGTLTLDGAISGTGSVRLIGAGTTVLAGNSSYTGATELAAGTLRVNGAIARSAVSVGSGATLAGNGTVGATSVQSGGTIAPGNSIGTLNVSGDYVQSAGAVYRVELDPASGASDRIAVTGTATVQSGAVLDAVRTSAAAYVPGTRYTVLTSNGGLTGVFDLTGETSVSPFLDLIGVYDAGNAYLEVRQTRDLASVAETPNQAATAGGLDSLSPTDPLTAPLLNLPSEDAARGVLDQLSGEVHASVRSLLLENSRFVRDAAVDRIRGTVCPEGTADRQGGNRPAPANCAGQSDGLSAWAQAFGSWGHADGNANTSRLERTIGGFVLGADAPVSGTWRAGALTGYSRSTFNVKGRSSSGSSNDTHVGLYGGTQQGALGVRAGAAYTWHDISTKRSPNGLGATESANADYRAQTAQVFGDVGYRIDAGMAAFEPFAALAYVTLHTDGFAERGGASVLAGRDGDTDATFTTLGVRAATAFAIGPVGIVARVTAGWRHAFGDVTPDATLSFTGSTPFGVQGIPIARDLALANAGIDLRLAPNAVFSLAYQGEFGAGTTQQGLQGTFSLLF